MGKNINKMADNIDRRNQEAGEAVEVAHVDAPASRYQTEQQIQSVATADKTTTPPNQFTPKKVKAQGGVLKQEVAASVISGASGSGDQVSSATAYGLKTMKQYSGDTGTILGSASGTPVMKGDNQGKTRVDKRLSDPNKDINYLASEQIAVEYDSIPSLAESDSTVGYNGNPKNMAARMQKASGATSAELLFERSVDMIVDDAALYSAGQVVKQSGVEYHDYPTQTFELNQSGNWDAKDFTLKRGNYAPREIQVTFKRDGDGAAYLSNFQVLEDDLSLENESYSNVNMAGPNEKRFMNLAEMARQRIDSKCGSPSQDHFNPLGRSIAEETATVGLLRDMETTAGSELFTAYKMANKARAYYLWRTQKDGQDLTTPAIDALYGHLMIQNGSQDVAAIFKQTQTNSDRQSGAFKNTEGIKAGSAALLLGLFDSWNKYKTKADVVTQARGLKLHLQTADNSINVFKVEPNFVAALNSVDVFSTIDRGYDPMNAICATDGVRLIHPYSWANSLKFTRAKYGAPRVYDDQLLVYRYKAGSGLNSYYVKCAEPLLNGVAYFLEMHADQIYDAIKDGSSGEAVLHIPTVHYGLHFGLWDYLLCAASPYIVYERTNTMKDILDYEVNFEYPFVELTSIGEANPMNAVNYRNLNSMEPLTPGQMLASSAVRWIMPETIVKMGHKKNTVNLMLPHYFSDVDYRPQGDQGLRRSGEHAISTPVIRSGVRLAFLDDLRSLDPKSYQLCYDRMIRNPYEDRTNPQDGGFIKGFSYRYAADAEGIPVVDVHGSTVTAQDYMATPRQMGWIAPAINGFCSRADIDAQADGSSVPYFAGPANLSTLKCAEYKVGPATRAIMYKGLAAANVVNTTLDNATVSVNRAQSFTQMWFVKYAYSVVASSNGFDVPLSISECFNNDGQLLANYTLFTPFVQDQQEGTGVVKVSGDDVFSMHRILWGIIQKTPFVLSPFEFAGLGKGFVDPLAIAYTFGLAGFMAADYEEEDYNRVNQVMNQGYGFTVDPFIQDSPLFRDALKHTQV